MATLTIPLRPGVPYQRFEVELEGIPYTFRFQWLDRAGWWLLTLLDADDNVLAAGVRLSVRYPLFARFKAGALPPGDLSLVDLQGEDAEPELNSLQVRHRLLYTEAADVLTFAEE